MQKLKDLKTTVSVKDVKSVDTLLKTLRYDFWELKPGAKTSFRNWDLYVITFGEAGIMPNNMQFALA